MKFGIVLSLFCLLLMVPAEGAKIPGRAEIIGGLLDPPGDDPCLEYLFGVAEEATEGNLPDVGGVGVCVPGGVGSARLCVGVTTQHVGRADDAGLSTFNDNPVVFAHSLPVAGGVAGSSLGYSSLDDTGYWENAISPGAVVSQIHTDPPLPHVDFVFAMAGEDITGCPTTML